MAKSLITQIFGVPSQSMPELIEPSDKIARLSEAKYAFETKRRKLEHQFEVTNSQLRKEYLSAVLEIHDSPEANGIQHAHHSGPHSHPLYHMESLRVVLAGRAAQGAWHTEQRRPEG